MEVCGMGAAPLGMWENRHFIIKVSKPCGRGADYVKMLLCMPCREGVSVKKPYKFLYSVCEGTFTEVTRHAGVGVH